MRIHNCNFCSAPVYPGHGLMLIRNDSTTFKFCKSKCRKAHNRKWHPIKTRWTKAYRTFHKKESYKLQNTVTDLNQYDRQVYLNVLKMMPQLQHLDATQRKAQIHKRIMEIKEMNKEIDTNILRKHGKLLLDLEENKNIEENTKKNEQIENEENISENVQMNTK